MFSFSDETTVNNVTSDESLFVSLISDKQEVFVINLYCGSKHAVGNN